jgi:hypothetical protein
VEGNDAWHVYEDVSYYVTEQSNCDVQMEAIRTESNINHSCRTVQFNNEYSQPLVYAELSSYHGGDTANVRLRNVTPTSVDIKVEEEWSANAETNHVNEFFSLIVYEGDASVLSQASAVTFNTFEEYQTTTHLCVLSLRQLFDNHGLI